MTKKKTEMAAMLPEPHDAMVASEEEAEVSAAQQGGDIPDGEDLNELLAAMDKAPDDEGLSPEDDTPTSDNDDPGAGDDGFASGSAELEPPAEDAPLPLRAISMRSRSRPSPNELPEKRKQRRIPLRKRPLSRRPGMFPNRAPPIPRRRSFSRRRRSSGQPGERLPPPFSPSRHIPKRKRRRASRTPFGMRSTTPTVPGKSSQAIWAALSRQTPGKPLSLWSTRVSASSSP